MLLLGVTLAAGVAALLAAKKMDIECLNPPAADRRVNRKAASRSPAAAEFGGGVLLRQQ